jgi:hypothetical protein
MPSLPPSGGQVGILFVLFVYTFYKSFRLAADMLPSGGQVFIPLGLRIMNLLIDDL